MITVAIIGLGSRGGMYGDRMRGFPDMKVVAICDMNKSLVDKKQAEWGIAPENCFTNPDDLFAKGKLADLILICSPDKFHYEQAMKALKVGYHVQLEKPIAQTIGEALEIEEYAKAHNLMVIICYVLRYSAYFRKIKDIIESGALGKIQQIQQTENVDFRHYCRSYVRGQWNVEASSTPFLFAKCSHDMDLLCWWAGSEPEWVSSLGELAFYKPENKPEGGGDDCRNCPLNDNKKCRFNAYNTYILKQPNDRFRDKFRSAKKRAELEKTIPEVQFKCAFSAGNDVMDKQTVTVKMKNGVLCSFATGGCRARRGRNMYIQGTKGELFAVEEEHTIKVFTEDDKKKVYRMARAMKDGGHAGGDAGVVLAVRDVLGGRTNPNDVSSIQMAIHSQKLCVVAELSRKQNGAMLNVDEEINKLK